LHRFPRARQLKRRIVFHAGPTNSGKTHAALERFRQAETGVYCAPLRLLAAEVYRRTNEDVSDFWNCFTIRTILPVKLINIYRMMQKNVCGK